MVLDAVICEPLRTPIGRFGGSLSSLSASELAEQVLRALVERTQLDVNLVDDVIFGNVYPTSEAPAFGRVAALDAGFPVSTPGMQIDRRCGSGLQAVIDAAMRIQTGVADLIVAGGAESMSQAIHYTNSVRRGMRHGSLELVDALERGRVTAGGRNHPVPGGMIETAENLRAEFGISREEQDEFAYASHQKAVRAQRLGLFDEEIVSVEVKSRNGLSTVSVDEHPRADISLETLAALKPIRERIDPLSTVTAGNASGENDAAAACIVTTTETADRIGLRPLVRLVSWGVAGVEPGRMGIGPVPATQRALDRAGLSLADMDLIELNEAFAAQALACTRGWGFADGDFDRLNVNGSGISLGHPVGATGTRILATLARELERRSARYGLETMCIGGGQGLAAIFERCGGGLAE